MSNDKSAFSEEAYEIMRQIDSVLATGSLEEAGMALAYLTGKWLIQLPCQTRRQAMLDFLGRVDLSMDIWSREEFNPCPQSKH